VDQAVGVRRDQAVDDLEEVLGRVGHAERPVGLDQVVQAVAGDVLHDHEVDAVLLAHVDGAGDVRMLDPLGQLHLAAEPLQGLASGRGELRGQDFDGDLKAVGLAQGEVDLAHPPLASLLRIRWPPRKNPLVIPPRSLRA
jgi:hypothetical protein